MPSLIHKVADSVLKRIRRSSLYYGRYNNTLDFATNRTYTRYTKECRAAYVAKDGIMDLPPSPLCKNGAMLVKGALPTAKAIACTAKITELIEKKDPRIEQSKKDSLSLHLSDTLLTLGADILDVLRNPEVHQNLLAYFRSHYRIYWVTGYRSLPTTAAVKGSWLWHSDSFPPHTCKMFLHLTKATGDTGATDFMNLEDTMMYRRAGYFGQFQKERYAELQDFAKDHNLPYRPFHLDAAPGDVTICDVNFFHRAVTPRAAFRDIVSFFFVPNPIHWEEQLKLDGIENISKRAAILPKDPHPGVAIATKGEARMM